MFWENRSLVDGEISYPLGKDAAGYISSFSDGFEGKFSGVRAATTALLGRGFSICVIVVPFDGPRKMVPN